MRYSGGLVCGWSNVCSEVFARVDLGCAVSPECGTTLFRLVDGLRALVLETATLVWCLGSVLLFVCAGLGHTERWYAH